MMLVVKIAIVLITSSLVSDVAAEKDCTQPNGYKYSVCGDGLKDANQLCCKTAEKCVQVKPFSGDDLVVCSEARQLTNTKAVKIVIIPLFFMFWQLSLIAYLVIRCNVKFSLVTQLCVAILLVSWPFLFSMHWAFGVYTAFLAAMVGIAAGPSIDCPKMPWWTYRLFWVAALFQIISLFGPNEAFHVPIYQHSNGVNVELIERIDSETSQTSCDSHYNNYFTVLSIETQVKEADPDAKYNGYCSKSWLATVQSFAVVQSVLWIGLALASAPTLLSAGGKTKDDNVKVISVLPAAP